MKEIEKLSNNSSSIINRVATENKQLIDGSEHHFWSLMESQIFQQSNYKDH